MYFLHSAFGLYISSNWAIPGLQVLSTVPKVDLKVWLARMPLWLQEQINAYQDESPALKLQKLRDGQYLQLIYDDGTDFVIEAKGSEVWSSWSDTLTLEDTATYLLGPILGFVLRLRGVTCLHASAVAVGERAIVLVGASGAGKSTTAAAFAKRGYSVLSDDIVALAEHRNTFLVQPAYPRIRLWSKSVDILYGKADALPRIVPTHPTWDKRYLDHTLGLQFQEEPLPLGAIYILGNRTADAAAPYIELVPTQQALMSLIANTYANVLLDKEMRTEEFKCLSQVVGLVPVRQVRAHVDPAYLPKLCDVIVEDFQNINTAEIA